MVVPRTSRARAAVASSYFYVDTLEHLRRGGRIGAAAALLGAALAVKPLLTVADGRVEPFEKVRTAGKALARIEELAARPDLSVENRRLVDAIELRVTRLLAEIYREVTA